MVKRLIPIVVAAMAATAFSSCSSGKKATTDTTMAYRQHPTECIARDPSGTVTLRVWGEGLDEKKARENAASKAVEEVTFSNITGNGASVMALIPGPTVRAKHRDYFNKFFKDGKYKKYIKTEKPDKGQYLTRQELMVVPVIVVVDREKLLDQFKKDAVLE